MLKKVHNILEVVPMLLGCWVNACDKADVSICELEMLSYSFLLEGQLSLLLSIFTNYSLHLDQLV